VVRDFWDTQYTKWEYARSSTIFRYYDENTSSINTVSPKMIKVGDCDVTV